MDIARCRAAKYCLQQAGCSNDELDMIIANDFINPLYVSRFIDKTIFINHHLAHASSAFFPSPFEEAAIFVADGCGSELGASGFQRESEFETTTFYYAAGRHIRELQKMRGSINEGFFPTNSIGEFYNSITKAIGFRFLEEGKTMGLAPYGKDTYVSQLERFYSIDESGVFIRNQTQIKEMEKFLQGLLRGVQDEEQRFQIGADIAFAGQYHLEKILIISCRALFNMTTSKNVCLAGGVPFNSAANYKILEHTPFENIFIFPAAGDGGTSIGSALYGYHVLTSHPRTPQEFFSPYLGKAYTHIDYEQAIQKHHRDIEVAMPENIFATVANLLSEGNIIGWFQGRAEVGPRALGNRSILADPREQNMKAILNKRVKHREWFRPFAPIVLAEKQHEYFTYGEFSPYMLLISPIIPEKQRIIPAVTHVDGTGRLQTVTEKSNPELHRLLDAYYMQTGIPILLNTSFNDNGMPMVETPADAMESFLLMDLDYLVLGNMLIKKKQAAVTNSYNFE
jgi:carbamoyltransferase